MPAPASSGSFADDLYRLLEPLARIDGGDEANGWALLHLVSAIGVPFQAIVDVVYEADDGTPGYAILMDADTCPTWALPWLAQFRGVRLPPIAVGELEADYWLAMRERIKRADGQNRGSVDALVAAAQRFLTGTKSVYVTERWGTDPYALHVNTVVSETPDPAAVLAALLEQKPAGLVLTYGTTDLVLSYDLLAASLPDYDTAAAFFTDYTDMATRSPV